VPGQALGLLHRLPGHLEALRRLSAREKLSYLLARARGIRKRLRRARWMLAYRLRARSRQPLPEALQDLYQIHRQALQEYVPRPYPGRLVLFRATIQSVQADPDPQMGWGKLAEGGLEIHEVPGDHVSLLVEPNVRLLAQQLAVCLQRIGSAPAAPR
jgi:oxalate---CoA ligase